jgi:hypothetical protein
MTEHTRVSFVVRVSFEPGGQLTGVVERVATGAKQAFTGVSAVGAVIARMLAGTPAAPAPVTLTDGAATDTVPSDSRFTSREVTDASPADGARPPPSRSSRRPR